MESLFTFDLRNSLEQLIFKLVDFFIGVLKHMSFKTAIHSVLIHHTLNKPHQLRRPKILILHLLSISSRLAGHPVSDQQPARVQSVASEHTAGGPEPHAGCR